MPGWTGISFTGDEFSGTIDDSVSIVAILLVQDSELDTASPNFDIRQITPTTSATTPVLIWDGAGEKLYETGLDRGVLYLSDGTVVPWNGLTSIVESLNRDSSSFYYDGMKISTLISVGDFSATMKAITYPEEFLEIEGMGQLMDGVFLGNQAVQSFNLSYRTLVGDDLKGNDSGYKIHILYNVLAVPKDTTYASMTDSLTPVEFEWDISAVQQEVDGHSPTAEIVINSKDVSVQFLQAVESILYGSSTAFPALPSLPDFITFLQGLSASFGTTILTITDNGDGTWTASTSETDLIVDNGDGTFSILNANATFDGDSYELSDTVVN